MSEKQSQYVYDGQKLTDNFGTIAWCDGGYGETVCSDCVPEANEEKL